MFTKLLQNRSVVWYLNALHITDNVITITITLAIYTDSQWSVHGNDIYNKNNNDQQSISITINLR